MPIRWTTPPQEAWSRAAENYVRAVRRGVHGVLQQAAPGIEAEMRNEAPWTDRTGNARQTLHTAVEPTTNVDSANVHSLIMAHGIDYGAYLEGYDPRHNFSPTAQGQRYAIVEPTLDRWGPIIWERIRRMIRGRR